jgi:hypothetical protein
MPDQEKCAGCGMVLNPPPSDAPDRVPCSICGSTARVIEVSFSATLEVYASIRFKHKRAGHKQPIAEGISGQEFYCKEQKWVNKERLIDREANPKRYREKVTDPDTGKVIHECDERLDQHSGHGSAKAKRQA